MGQGSRGGSAHRSASGRTLDDLPGIALPDGVLPTQSLAELAGAACLLVAVPAQVLRSVVSGAAAPRTRRW